MLAGHAPSASRTAPGRLSNSDSVATMKQPPGNTRCSTYESQASTSTTKAGSPSGTVAAGATTAETKTSLAAATAASWTASLVLYAA